MKSAIALACLAAMTTLNACIPAPMSAEPPAQRARIAYLKGIDSRPIYCTAGDDCAQKWARAQKWVATHSSYSIVSVTDSEIKTAGPVEPTTDAAFIVTKTPAEGNTFTIKFSSTCGMLTGGKPVPCVPTSMELDAAFHNFVLYDIKQGNY